MVSIGSVRYLRHKSIFAQRQRLPEAPGIWRIIRTITDNRTTTVNGNRISRRMFVILDKNFPFSRRSGPRKDYWNCYCELNRCCNRTRSRDCHPEFLKKRAKFPDVGNKGKTFGIITVILAPRSRCIQTRYRVAGIFCIRKKRNQNNYELEDDLGILRPKS